VCSIKDKYNEFTDGLKMFMDNKYFKVNPECKHFANKIPVNYFNDLQELTRQQQILNPPNWSPVIYGNTMPFLGGGTLI
jgi:hypothetical protein